MTKSALLGFIFIIIAALLIGSPWDLDNVSMKNETLDVIGGMFCILGGALIVWK